MRHVFPTREIPHLWASQAQADARNPQRNLFFEGPTIYSYRTSWPLARIHTRGKRKLVLSNCDRYSTTTAQHQSAVDRAVSHLDNIAVPFPELSEFDSGRHIANLAHLEKNAAKALDTAKRVLREWGATYRREAYDGLREQHAKYRRFFGIKAPGIPARTAEWDAAVARAQSIEKPDPIRDAKRFKAREARERGLVAKAERLAAEISAAHAQELAEWQSGARNWAPSLTFSTRAYSSRLAQLIRERMTADTRGARLRLSADGTEIETSQGARIPASYARRLWDLIGATRAAGEPFVPAAPFKIGPYELREVTAEGDLRVGCHFITFAELETMARRLGFIA